jgi:rhomboid protease GluP
MGNAIFIIVINLFIGLTPGIDNWGHVGGLLGGAMFAWFAGPLWQVVGIPPEVKLDDQREFRDWLTGACIVLLVFGLLAGWGLFNG